MSKRNKNVFTAPLRRKGLLLVAAALVIAPLSAQAAPATGPALTAELQARFTSELLPFYAARDFRPLWITADGRLDPGAKSLHNLLETARYDGLDPSALGVSELEQAIRMAEERGSPADLAEAETVLSRIFVRYVKALRQLPSAEMIYEHQSLRPFVPTVADALRDVARADSLTAHVEQMQWMHPLYAPLRRALASGEASDAATRATVVSNLQRIRALPAEPFGGRHVLVDTASARLWMYENGRVVDSMRVVVGKANQQTPIMSGFIRYATLNPYWNVPKDLVTRNIAPAVDRGGIGFLKSRGYEVLTDWGPDAVPIDPASVDWKAAVRGDIIPRVRQLPGSANAMGRVKYEFPNTLGIFLHDTPDKNLMLKDERQLSSGCIRLEDAERLGRWLFEGALPSGSGSADPEQKVDLPKLVPVYVTYLTAHLDNGQLAVLADPYDLDSMQQESFADLGATAPAAQPWQSDSQPLLHRASVR